MTTAARPDAKRRTRVDRSRGRPKGPLFHARKKVTAVSGLTEQDHTDLLRANELAEDAFALIKAVEARHGLDITGPALSAFERAAVAIEMAERDVRLGEKYLGAS